MGKSRSLPYRIEFAGVRASDGARVSMTPIGMTTRPKDLGAYVEALMEQNGLHFSSCVLIRQSTGSVIDTYKPPMFRVNGGRKTRKNPPLVVFGNPSGGGALLSDRAYALSYRHAGDGKDYEHPFKTGVRIELMPDGSIRLYRADQKPLWRNF